MLPLTRTGVRLGCSLRLPFFLFFFRVCFSIFLLVLFLCDGAAKSKHTSNAHELLTTTEIFVARFKPSFSFGFQSQREAKLSAVKLEEADDVIVSSSRSLRCDLARLVLFALLFWALNSPAVSLSLAQSAELCGLVECGF